MGGCPRTAVVGMALPQVACRPCGTSGEHRWNCLQRIQAWSSHYVRKPHPRCARTKDRDVQIAHLHHCVSHYRVIRDTRPSTSLIHWRHVKSERFADYKTHPRCALRVCVSDLIPGWAPYDTNTRRAQGHASPITKKYETRFLLERH
jgi:hypothetical protein